MAIMSTVAVLHCPRCGKPVVSQHVETYKDASGEKLHRIMAHLGEIAYCKDCLAARNYYIQVRRLPEWFGGRDS